MYACKDDAESDGKAEQEGGDASELKTVIELCQGPVIGRGEDEMDE